MAGAVLAGVLLALDSGTLFAPKVFAQHAAAVAGAETVVTFDPAQSTVHWTLDSTLHTVHGTFALKSGTVHFDPATGKAGGEIVVSAASGETGNSSRDAKMHKEILETAKFPDAVFRPSSIEGKVASAGASDVKLHGVLSIHGSDHELTAAVHLENTEEHWKGTCTFEVPYVAWGIKDPSNFLLKVKPVANVEMDAAGAVQTDQ